MNKEEEYDQEIEMHYDALTDVQKTMLMDQSEKRPRYRDNLLLKRCMCAVHMNGPRPDCPLCSGFGWVPSRPGLEILQLLNAVKALNWFRENYAKDELYDEQDADNGDNETKY